MLEKIGDCTVAVLLIVHLAWLKKRRDPWQKATIPSEVGRAPRVACSTWQLRWLGSLVDSANVHGINDIVIGGWRSA
ncbi:MAG: hypothetical protein AAGG44_21395 [Planctomycetota bacterium]